VPEGQVELHRVSLAPQRIDSSRRQFAARAERKLFALPRGSTRSLTFSNTKLPAKDAPPCHAAHGSVNAKLLTGARFDPVHEVSFPAREWRKNSHRRILITRCACNRALAGQAGCHEAVHGSRVSSSLRF
jgi:hypothetical protein